MLHKLVVYIYVDIQVIHIIMGEKAIWLDIIIIFFSQGDTRMTGAITTN